MMQIAERETYVFNRAPVMLYWEVTRACDLTCAHCRADAIPERDPRELTSLEAVGLIHQIARFDRPLPHLVITGGDPFKRPDLNDLVREAVRNNIQVALAPSVTNLLTHQALARLGQAGLSGLSLSLDGATAARHDRLRGVPGCFDRTVDMARFAVATGFPLQINTLVCAETVADLPALFELVKSLKIRRWSLFFLIAVGRGRALQSLTAEQADQVCHWLFTRALEAPFIIAPTEAPFYRRVAIERMRRSGLLQRGVDLVNVSRSFGIRDGNGIMFISHTGEVYPSGFLPVRAGSARETPAADLYRQEPVFTALRDVNRFEGKCSRCLFKVICGGSRARAYAHTGNYLAADPLCAYEP